ncbi:hypothetical protein A3715_16545 [Oleiphilus sp. HI0009]|uniref:DUF2165 family protein n=1 Tax=unclassified Oleiphilus TaxID=2631174 RepID=UPI0007C28887|nr:MULTISPECIES: DUF2165 domain-containing protein [unclassified Oleiphilus]KZX86211.1 hypothetical protein A3715_16545 [Oleiphilus sp. HI0009]MCH2157336.1 DUF2165 domain-containing protein [Oleiphilaceae bacterium]KZY67075.1 hypothetical protein A3738_05170 [Oleiphilus sp. HI0066]KZY71165.1 hypothetical protein A3739_05595 [Oleiphilus sp. HI0067]KZZ57692.1 hypothetical protein A3762_09245 [Oleiphilus sp. HI0125]
MLHKIHRLSKGCVAAAIGIFCFLVGYNNIVDYNTNYQFVEHVLSMDTMEAWFAGEELKSRAIESSTLKTLGYWAIIAAELSAGILGVAAAFLMLKNTNHGGSQFHTGQALFVLSATIAVLVWYFGFGVVGAEWFQMWANQWNGQMKAYTFATFILIAAIYILLPSPREWEETSN